MKKAIQISIQNPCPENWSKMKPVNKGRYCAVCSKNVIDFTQYSNEQLIKHLEKERNICGRFKSHQLNKKITLERKDKNSFSGYAASLFFTFLTFGNHSARAQEKPKIEQTDKKFVSLEISNQKNNQKNKIMNVSGVIKDDSEPLPGVTIVIKGTNKGTITDFDGNFSLEATIGDVLQVSFIGYITQEVIVKENNPEITLELDVDIQGEIIVGGAYTANNPKRLFYKNPFRYKRRY